MPGKDSKEEPTNTSPYLKYKTTLANAAEKYGWASINKSIQGAKEIQVNSAPPSNKHEFYLVVDEYHDKIPADARDVEDEDTFTCCKMS